MLVIVNQFEEAVDGGQRDSRLIETGHRGVGWPSTLSHWLVADVGASEIATSMRMSDGVVRCWCVNKKLMA